MAFGRKVQTKLLPSKIGSAIAPMEFLLSVIAMLYSHHDRGEEFGDDTGACDNVHLTGYQGIGPISDVSKRSVVRIRGPLLWMGWRRIELLRADGGEMACEVVRTFPRGSTSLLDSETRIQKPFVGPGVR